MNLKQRKILRNLIIILLLLGVIWAVGYFITTTQKNNLLINEQLPNSNADKIPPKNELLPDPPEIPESSKNSSQQLDPNNLPAAPSIPQ